MIPAIPVQPVREVVLQAQQEMMEQPALRVQMALPVYRELQVLKVLPGQRARKAWQVQRAQMGLPARQGQPVHKVLPELMAQRVSQVARVRLVRKEQPVQTELQAPMVLQVRKA